MVDPARARLVQKPAGKSASRQLVSKDGLGLDLPGHVNAAFRPLVLLLCVCSFKGAFLILMERLFRARPTLSFL